MAATKSAEFSKAIADSEKLKAKPTDNELLALYAHFKQGNQDPPFEEAKKPGMFDLKNKYKYQEWEKVAQSGMSAEDAQKKYVELVEQLKEKYGFEG